MGEGLSADAARALAVLAKDGLLLVTDARLPSLVALVAGAPVRGSWWGHPRGGAIYQAALQLEDHPDVAVVKLVSGKATLVHRRLWPALLAVAAAREPWQTRGLARGARALLQRVEKEGGLRADRVPGAREHARALEERLLVHAGSVHTEKGAHARALESWRRWAKRVGARPAGSGAQGRHALEQALQDIVARHGGRASLPWQSVVRRQDRRR